LSPFVSNDENQHNYAPIKKNLQKIIKQKKIKLTHYKIQKNSYPVQFQFQNFEIDSAKIKSNIKEI